ncbi:hypothetical protein DPMN_171809 [Dreissena polymorpha]|uniref:Uncharacterized protein n=1 Tax=Dreissena polymorpha TaxID=45954 RepID=A0A9D4E2C7_DREPO|nr:hypothetical protein DPMN_171809 [Dreissena polymorpha]
MYLKDSKNIVPSSKDSVSINVVPSASDNASKNYQYKNNVKTSSRGNIVNVNQKCRNILSQPTALSVKTVGTDAYQTAVTSLSGIIKRSSNDITSLGFRVSTNGLIPSRDNKSRNEYKYSNIPNRQCQYQ